MIVVIPTCRGVDLNLLSPLIEAGARFIVVDDSEGSISIPHRQFQTFNWGDQRRMLGSKAQAIPRRNGACRDFGFFIAWKESDQHEIIVALDDDCLVDDPDFPTAVEQALETGIRSLAKGTGPYFNPLDLYTDVEPEVYPRGFPYSARSGYRPWSFEPSQRATAVDFNLGLWRGVFDVNAIDKISGPTWRYDHVNLDPKQVVVPEGVLLSVCSMNMHFRRELIPAVYQMPMHVEVLPGWVVDRYGDIWGGYVLKTLMDLAGDVFAVGEPMISHLKEAGYQRNIWQEHIAHLINDEFVELLGNAREEIAAGSYLEMMEQLTEELERRRERTSGLLARYLDVLLPAMRAWVQALS